MAVARAACPTASTVDRLQRHRAGPDARATARRGGVSVEGHPFVRYAADAVIVATPTGSTAYSFSAGGPIVSPTVEGCWSCPAAAHSAFNRALVLSADEELDLELLPTSGRLAVEVDGMVAGQSSPATG